MLKPRRRRLSAGNWPVVLAGMNWRWSPVILALAFGLLTALVMPQQNPFPYRFKKNGTWNYPALKSPFDFEVLRPEAEVHDQLKQILAEHAPYYRLDPNVGRQQKERFQSFIEERKRLSANDVRYEDLVKNPGRYLSYGQKLLDYLFSRGIASAELEALQKEDPGASIFLMQNSLERRLPARAVLTLSGARAFLIDTMPYSPLRQPELLLPVLESSLAPNVFFDDSLSVVKKSQKITAVRSTGISVQKGEIVVEKGDWISDITYQKLESLHSRYETRSGLLVVLGYGVLAFISFVLFFIWIRTNYPLVWNSREMLLLSPALVILLLLLLNVTQWINPAFAMALPFWALPLVLKRSPLGLAIGGATWLIVLLLSTISTDWSAAWLAIQMTGAAVLLLAFPVSAAKWPARFGAIALTTLVQIVAWWACNLTGNIPALLKSVDSCFPLLFANGLLLLLIPVLNNWMLSRQAFPEHKKFN